MEGIWYVPLTLRTSFGVRAEGQYIRPYGSTQTLPIFEKLFSGGEYSVRGFDIRTVSPRDAESGLLLGGNKMLTFNAEYYITLFGQARVVLFYDAAQVRDVGQRFGWKEDVTRVVVPEIPVLTDIFANPNLITKPGGVFTEVIGHTSAFKTSTGVEVRFFLPVLNVPFRLIGAYNPQRRNVINNNGEPTPEFTFRFAVGTTF
jgi:outer membrane protein assembly factor BamA